MDDFNTDFAKELFQLGIDLNTPGPQVPMDLVRDLELSIQVDVVALALARAAWIMAGVRAGIPEPRWAEFPHALRERYRGLAERAIQTIDPQVRLDAKNEAAKDTADFLDWPAIEHVVNEGISRYESKLAQLRVSGGGA